MKISLVYHSDLDGIVAAAVLWNRLRAGDKDPLDVQLMKANYGDITVDQIMETEVDEVYMVDFSLPVDEMCQILEAYGERFTWIDHHKTALEAMEGIEIKGLQRTDRSGAWLTWEYVTGQTKDPPQLVELADAWDTWRWRRETSSDPHFLNTWICNTYPVNEFDISAIQWARLRLDYGEPLANDIAAGQEIVEQQRNTDRKILDKEAFDVTFDGKRGMAINRRVNSIFFDPVVESCAPGEDPYTFFVSFTYTQQGQVRCSVYSEDESFDCSAIAQSMGGGGHRGAAGFVASPLQFGQWLDSLMRIPYYCIICGKQTGSIGIYAPIPEATFCSETCYQKYQKDE